MLLQLAYLFMIGSILGWCLELLFRRFISEVNPERKWINPGFCTGPYLPLYGTGLALLYLIAAVEKYNLIQHPVWNKIVLFAVMAICMTTIEYIAGVISLKYFKVRLWDYRKEWGNIQGVICPRFSFYWAVMGALYYFLIHPRILHALDWLANNLAFSFFIGLFFGVFIIDCAHSAQLITKLKAYAEEYEAELRFEEIKAHIRRRREEKKLRYSFFRPFRTDRPLADCVRDFVEELEEHRDNFKHLHKRK